LSCDDDEGTIAGRLSVAGGRCLRVSAANVSAEHGAGRSSEQISRTAALKFPSSSFMDTIFAKYLSDSTALVRLVVDRASA